MNSNTARNLRLCASSLPEEVLGEVFSWTFVLRADGPLEPSGKIAYNFLFVCRRWRRAALNTPRLWRRWAPGLADWRLRSTLYRGGPLDLSLIGFSSSAGDADLLEVLRGCAMRGAIWRVNLTATAAFIREVLSSVAVGEPLSSSLVELSLVNGDESADEQMPDVSSLFTDPLPKLRRLVLAGCFVPWDALMHTAALTTLDVYQITPRSAPSLSQLLPVLSANPLLRRLQLTLPPFIGEAWSPAPVPLPHLTDLNVDGLFVDVFRLLDHLELPDRLDDMRLSLVECTALNLTTFLPAYIGLRAELWNGPLKVLAAAAHPEPVHGFDCLEVSVGCPEKHDDHDAGWFLTVSARLMQEEWGLATAHQNDAAHQVVACIPQIKIVDLRTTVPILELQDLCAGMRNLKTLRLTSADVSRLASTDGDGNGLLPELRSLLISRLYPRWDGDWSPFVRLLVDRAANGRRISTLELGRCRDMDEAVAQSISAAVGSLRWFGSIGGFELRDTSCLRWE